MSKIYTPIHLDIHKVGNVEVQITMHNAGDQTKPKDDFAVISVKIYRDDGTHALTLSSFFADGVEPKLNFLPMKECRNRMQPEAEANVEPATNVDVQIDLVFDATNAGPEITLEAAKQHG